MKVSSLHCDLAISLIRETYFAEVIVKSNAGLPSQFAIKYLSKLAEPNDYSDEYAWRIIERRKFQF